MKFISLSSLCSLFLALSCTLAFADDAEPVRVRVAAANISSGRMQSYDPGEGIRLFEAAKPDVVAIQEANYGNKSDADFRKFVDETFGKEFYFYREGPHFNIPNGIVSRFPIEKSGSWPDPLPGVRDRSFAWAQIRLPNGEHLWMVSVHLNTKSAPNRQIEAKELVSLIQKNIPPNAKMVIAGDFNTKSDKESAVKTLSELAGEAHPPEAEDGKTATNSPRNKKYDWVIASPELDRFHVPTELVIDPKAPEHSGVETFPNGFVFDTRAMREVPEPAKPEDSAAEGMQHMMVLKDFLIPGTTAHRETPAPSTETNRAHDD